MFARDDRLHPRSRVRATIRQGRRVRRGCLLVHFVADCDRPQAAVVVSKGFGGAVERHRRQRQIRHALASVWDELPAGSIVVRAFPSDDDFAKISHDLREAVHRL